MQRHIRKSEHINIYIIHLFLYMPSKAFTPMKGIVKLGSAGDSLRATIPEEIVTHLGLKKGIWLSASVDDRGRIVFEVKR